MAQEQDEKRAKKFVSLVRTKCGSFVSFFAGCVFRRKKSASVLWFIASLRSLFFDGFRSSGTELDERGDLSGEEAKSRRAWRISSLALDCVRGRGAAALLLSLS